MTPAVAGNGPPLTMICSVRGNRMLSQVSSSMDGTIFLVVFRRYRITDSPALQSSAIS
jgi:hypothetical protein